MSRVKTFFQSTTILKLKKIGKILNLNIYPKKFYNKGFRSIFAAPGSIQTKMGKKVKNQKYSTFIEPENLADFLISLILQNENMIINEVSINRANYK